MCLRVTPAPASPRARVVRRWVGLAHHRDTASLGGALQPEGEGRHHAALSVDTRLPGGLRRRGGCSFLSSRPLCGQLASVATQSRADARRCSLQNGRNPRTPKQRQDLPPGAPASGRRVPPASSLRHMCAWTPCPRPSWRRRAHSSLFPAVSAEAQAFPSPTGLCHPRTPPSAVPGPPGATAPTTRVCGGGFSSPTRLGSR